METKGYNFVTQSFFWNNYIIFLKKVKYFFNRAKFRQLFTKKLSKNYVNGLTGFRGKILEKGHILW